MTEKDSKAYMYVVECADGTLYTGYKPYLVDALSFTEAEARII